MSDDQHLAELKAIIDARPPEVTARHQAQLRAYLQQRGHDLAKDLDLDLGQLLADDLAELGRLDCIASHPDIPPNLAPVLAMAHDRNQADRQRLEQTAPEHDWKPDRPTSERPDATSGVDQGRTPSRSRDVQKRDDRNGKKDPIRQMIDYEPPDEEWTR
jgi:hypothetical protein